MKFRTGPHAAALLTLVFFTAGCASRAPRTAAAPPPAGSTQAPPATQTASDEEIGSTRNARVALADPSSEADLTYLSGPLNSEELAAVARLAPHLRIVTDPTPAQALELAPTVRAIDARYATAEFLARAKRLVWVQAMSAGVDRLVGRPGIADRDEVVLTNLRGVHGPAIADHAFALLLLLTRDLRPRLADQAGRHWGRGDDVGTPIALKGRTMLVVGLGGIGSEIAERARGFGMRVIATRRSDAPAPPGIEKVGRPDELLALLPEADVVAICVPLTAETEHLFGARAFAAMKPGAWLINIARGKIVDTDALVAALAEHRLAGACLDVTDPEPLPAASPLWAMENVVITPHVASDARITDQRALALLKENLRRFAAGEPLLNVVDKKAGY
jgi:phosphoglycerate dehydrogenase-like enzyme